MYKNARIIIFAPLQHNRASLTKKIRTVILLRKETHLVTLLWQLKVPVAARHLINTKHQ